MEIRVLGPLEVRADRVTLSLGAPKQQVVLALLVVNTGRVVQLADLIDELWPEQPPASAVENVRSYAANLRRLFDSVESGRNRLVRRGTGYLLSAGVEELDLLSFEDEVRRAREALQRRDHTLASRLFTEALGRWHGDVLAGLKRGPLLDARCNSIDAERLAVTEETAELYVSMGEPGRSVALLREHVLRHPLREHAQALLIRSMYLAGDAAGALSAYVAARAALVDQLGMEPGVELQAMHRAVLRRDVAPLGTHSSPVVPRELPAEPVCFIGRDAVTGNLSTMLTDRDRAASHRPAVAVVYGEGGVGKSALAVHVAHLVADQFPDGHLYLDLFGFTPGLQPLSTVEALGRMLRSLGLSPRDTPSSEADAATLFRSLTADRRLLLVLDNVRDASQVVPLLPASPQSAVLITCRGPLATIDAEARVRLDALSTRSGVALLQALTRDATGVAAAARLVELCDHLPLAIRIAAGRLIGRPDLGTGEFIERLTDERRRLDELELEGFVVRSCITVGYNALASGTSPLERVAARVFRNLGLLKVPDVQPDVVAAMLSTKPDPSSARAALDILVGIQLAEPVPGGRYRLHDLVRLVAAELATQEDGPDETEATQRRAMYYYLDHLRSAADLLQPGRVEHLGYQRASNDRHCPSFPTLQAAAAWVRAEQANLAAAAEQSSRMPGDAHRFTLWLSYLTASTLYVTFDWWRAAELGRLVLDTAERRADWEMAGWGHLMVGFSDAERGSEQAAEFHFDRALNDFGDCSGYGAALALNAKGVVAGMAGRSTEAVIHLEAGLDRARRNGLSAAEGTVCFNLGNIYAGLGEWSRAMEYLGRSLAIRSALSDRGGMGVVLMVLAVVHCREGNMDHARQCATEAVVCCRETGQRFRESNALLVASELDLRRHAHDDAFALAETVLSMARADGNRYAEAAALRQLAKVLAARGDNAAADERFAEADAAFLRVTIRLDQILEGLFVETAPPIRTR